MLFHVCDICKVRSQLPDGICISCAYGNEYKRRITLELHLFQLLDLMRGCITQVEAAVNLVQKGEIKGSDLAQAMEQVRMLNAPKPEEPKP